MKRFLVLAAALALPACGSLESGGEAALACPDVQILADAANQVSFRPGTGRDLTDVVRAVTLADYRGECSQTRSRRDVTVALEVRFAIEQGPAATGDAGDFEYFVAITRLSGEVVTKKRFVAEFALQGSRRGTMVESLEQVIPLVPGDRGDNYRIVIGLQLTPEQLEFNRKQRGS